jgi:hypothetical protein
MTPRDPRLFQIAALSALLLYGLLALDFEVRWGSVLLLLVTAQVTQWLGSRWSGIRYDPKSPLISALSLCLLLRASGWPWLVAGAVVTIGSKFVLRVGSEDGGKHVFNPTNFGLVALLLVTPFFEGGAWVSPGQWGRGALFLFFLLLAGNVVLRRASRSDVTWAFLGTWVAILFGRALWLGDPLAIPLHALGDGALLIFAFFMISDPKTTPDSRAGRIVFAVAVAAAGAWGRFVLFETDALLYALAGAAVLTPLLDRLLPAARYRWPGARPRTETPSPKETDMPSPQTAPSPAWSPAPAALRGARGTLLLLVLLLSSLAAGPATAFCGFYVARAESDLFNQASRVVLVRDGHRTVLTMASDFQGEPSEFAVVIPVPTFLEREQIHVGNMAAVDHLDAYTAPRLVEYHDPNPCFRARNEALQMEAAAPPPPPPSPASPARKVKIEASYTVGEYDILILSAEESDGLVSWLQENGYRVPDGAEPVVASYLKQGMRFFVAKVNLEEQARLGYRMLRPLQVAFETPKFMLPIRLGTVNAKGPQELFVYTLTKKGRVETVNYRTVKLPSDVEIPTYVRREFPAFYRDMFSRQVEEQGMRTVFLEYAWDMGWCDPCAADPLSSSELRDLGVFWLDGGAPPQGRRPAPAPGPQDVFVTRLHVRYDREHFPQDLQFQETADRSNFQGRYVLRNAWTGEASCEGADEYRRELARRHETEAETLAGLTGWELGEIRERMGLTGAAPADEPWWQRLWPGR